MAAGRTSKYTPGTMFRRSDVYSGNSDRRHCRRVLSDRIITTFDEDPSTYDNGRYCPSATLPQSHTHTHPYPHAPTNTSFQSGVTLGAMDFWKKTFWIKQFSTLWTANNWRVTLFYEKVANVLMNIKSTSVIVCTLNEKRFLLYFKFVPRIRRIFGERVPWNANYGDAHRRRAGHVCERAVITKRSKTKTEIQ